LVQLNGARPRRRYDPGLGLVQGAFLLLIVPHLGFVPLWDSAEYADRCLFPALRSLNPLELNCFGHPSMGYMGVLAVPQILFGPSAVILNLSNAMLGVASIWAVFAIVRATYPGCPPRDRCLLTAIYAFWPAVVASCLNMSPDFGVLVFALLTLAFLLRGERLRAVIAGLFLVLSKEMGVLLYGIAVAGSFLLLRGLPETPPLEMKRRAPGWVLLIPLAVVGLMTALQLVSHRSGIFFGLEEKGRWTLDPRTIATGAYAPAIWILNGGWVLTLCFAAAPIAALLFPAARRRWTGPAIGRNRSWFFLALFLIAGAYGLTRYETFLNVRYLLALYPVLIVIWFFPVSVMAGEGRIRSACLAVALVWVAAGVHRTVDPVSKWIWGTFDFGRHELLSLTSLTGECCGFGRDQLPYNLEFLRFHEIQNDIYSWIRPGVSTTLVANRRADRMGRVTPDGRRTSRLDDALTVHFVTAESLERRFRRPEVVFFFAFPNFANVADLTRLRERYLIESVRTFARSGYAIPVYVLRAKSVQPPELIGPRRLLSSDWLGRADEPEPSPTPIPRRVGPGRAYNRISLNDSDPFSDPRIGMVVFAARESAPRTSDNLAECGDRFFSIGKFVPGSRRVRSDRLEDTLPA
jgi:hypothetical protein